MSEHTPTPKLVMGHIEIVANGKTSVPDDDAVIHIDGDEDSEIEVHFPNALQLAPFIVKAVNSHDALVKALEEIISGGSNEPYLIARKALASIKERS